MATNNVRIRHQTTADTSRRKSDAIWGTCPLQEIEEGIRDGQRDGDDFKYLQSEDGNDDASDGYQKYIDTGNTIRLAATSTTLYGGNVQLATDATDNDAPVIHRYGSNNAGSSLISPFFIGATSGAIFPLWFEARLKIASISDDVTAWFCGLGMASTASTFAADNGLLEDDTGDVVDSKSVIGFRVKHKNGGTSGQNALLDFVYQDSAQTAPVVVQAGIATLANDTFFKVGFVYTPWDDANHQIKLYYNNIEQGTYVTSTNIAAATFPSNDQMNFVCGQKNGSANAGTLTLDWWQCVQLLEPL